MRWICDIWLEMWGSWPGWPTRWSTRPVLLRRRSNLMWWENTWKVFDAQSNRSVFVDITQWAGVAYHKRSWLSTALCSKSDGLIWVDRDSVQSIQYGKWMISAHCFAWFRLGQFYYYDSTQKLKVSKHDKVHFRPVWQPLDSKWP